MKIKITKFAERHFDPKFGGTKILDITKDLFEEFINNEMVTKPLEDRYSTSTVIPSDGYAPFCKLLAIKNFTDARVGSMPITLENYQYLRSGYSARTEKELPVFSRWLELPLGKPKANWLVLVLYSREQLLVEHQCEWVKGDMNGPMPEFELPEGTDWGVVAILGQTHSNEEPMKPETMLRNALGIEYGGSGVALDKDKYLESVKFWDKNATVK